MYSEIKSVQIVVSLLKQYEVKDIVLSPGGSDIPLIHSIEMDSYFTCHSVVDERSAAYFAMGVAQQKHNPCACICTSGTAVCNYVPGITEAFYQDVPVVAITADKNPYYQDQLETQKIEQSHMFDGVVKKSVELPVVKDAEDEWLCNRLVNEALIEMNHHGTGPVHINIPIVGATNVYDCPVLPTQRKIELIERKFDLQWEIYAKKLIGKRVLVVVGQNIYFDDPLKIKMGQFFERYNCAFSVEHMSNLDCNGVINTYPITEMFHQNEIDVLHPEVVISLGNNLAAYNLKPMLRKNYRVMENWLVHPSGKIRDAYKCLNVVFECSPESFFEGIMSVDIGETKNTHSYYNEWIEFKNRIHLPKFEFSNFYVAERLSKVIPANSVVHLAILNSTRIMQFFDLAKGVTTYSNVGALGIDGCLSTFAGQAASTKELSYLVIGDLSFFYDMNAAGLRDISPNVRIILLNNGGGSEFQFFMGKRNIPELDRYICAEHEKVAAGWVWSLGYDYYAATNIEEFDEVIEKFGKPSDKPMFLEVFGDMEEEANRTNVMYDQYRMIASGGTNVVKKMINSVLPEKQKQKVKKIIQILKEK